MLYNALDYAPSLTMPIFMHSGSEDDWCPVENQKVLFESLGSLDKELHIIDGAPHVYVEKQHLEALKTALEVWFGGLKG